MGAYSLVRSLIDQYVTHPFERVRERMSMGMTKLDTFLQGVGGVGEKPSEAKSLESEAGHPKLAPLTSKQQTQARQLLGGLALGEGVISSKVREIALPPRRIRWCVTSNHLRNEPYDKEMDLALAQRLPGKVNRAAAHGNITADHFLRCADLFPECCPVVMRAVAESDMVELSRVLLLSLLFDIPVDLQALTGIDLAAPFHNMGLEGGLMWCAPGALNYRGPPSPSFCEEMVRRGLEADASQFALKGLRADPSRTDLVPFVRLDDVGEESPAVFRALYSGKLQTRASVDRFYGVEIQAPPSEYETINGLRYYPHAARPDFFLLAQVATSRFQIACAVRLADPEWLEWLFGGTFSNPPGYLLELPSLYRAFVRCGMSIRDALLVPLHHRDAFQAIWTEHLADATPRERPLWCWSRAEPGWDTIQGRTSKELQNLLFLLVADVYIRRVKLKRRIHSRCLLPPLAIVREVPLDDRIVAILMGDHLKWPDSTVVEVDTGRGHITLPLQYLIHYVCVASSPDYRDREVLKNTLIHAGMTRDNMPQEAILLKNFGFRPAKDSVLFDNWPATYDQVLEYAGILPDNPSVGLLCALVFDGNPIAEVETSLHKRMVRHILDLGIRPTFPQTFRPLFSEAYIDLTEEDWRYFFQQDEHVPHVRVHSTEEAVAVMFDSSFEGVAESPFDPNTWMGWMFESSIPRLEEVKGMDALLRAFVDSCDLGEQAEFALCKFPRHGLPALSIPERAETDWTVTTSRGYRARVSPTHFLSHFPGIRCTTLPIVEKVDWERVTNVAEAVERFGDPPVDIMRRAASQLTDDWCYQWVEEPDFVERAAECKFYKTVFKLLKDSKLVGLTKPPSLYLGWLMMVDGMTIPPEHSPVLTRMALAESTLEDRKLWNEFCRKSGRPYFCRETLPLSL